MKKLFKNSMFVFIFMLVSMIGIMNVYADSDVAEIRIYNSSNNLTFSKRYTSPTEAIYKLNDVANSGQKVEIDFFADITVDARITINDNAKIEMNLNGHMIRRVWVKHSDGEVIYLGKGAELTVNGGASEEAKNIEHTINYANDKDYNRNKTVTIKGGLITGGHSSNSAGGIFAKENSKIVLNDVSLSGNISNGDNGGGINIDGPNVKLNMNNSNISYNLSGYDGGGIYVYGGIWKDAEHCTVRMKNSHIDNNYAIGFGGGIAVDAEWFNLVGDAKANYSVKNKNDTGNLKGSTISNNITLLDGGGVWLNEENSSITGINFIGNKAFEGGGIALKNENISVSNCTIIGNNSSEYGGGIYVGNNDSNSISNSSIMFNNSSEYGGGVYVGHEVNIGLSGILYIKDNTSPESKKANLYLDYSTYIDGNPDAKSDIHISTLKRDSLFHIRYVSENKGTYNVKVYTSDDPEYFIGWDRDGDRILKQYEVEDYTAEQRAYLMGKSNVGTTSVNSNNRVLDTSRVYSVDGKDYQIIKGVSSGPKVTNDYEDFNSIYYYSDGYFAEDENVYNKHLASMSLSLELSGFNSNKSNINPFDSSILEKDYSEKFNNVQQILGDIGFKNIYANDYMSVQPSKDSIGVTIANKKTTIGEDEKYIIPIVVRGGGYEREWISNVTLNYENNNTAEAYGFATPASKVLKEVENYINSHELKDALDSGKIIFWPVGYSRGGATANITAKNLIEKYVYKDGNKTGNKVFAYTFEAPQGGADSAEKLSDKTSYYSIHNAINKTDVVPLVGPTRMGLKRYGVDHYIPGGEAGEVKVTTKTVSGAYSGNSTVTTYADNSNYIVSKETNSNYYKERTKMIKQLATINKDITFDDYFKQAELNLMKAKFFWDQLSEKNSDLTQEAFLTDFLDKLQRYNDGQHDYAFRNRTNFSKNYKTSSDKGNDRAFQSVLQDLFGLVYSKTDEDIAGIKASVSDLPDRIDSFNWFWEDEDISMINIYDKVIEDWNDLSASEQKKYEDFFWKILTQDGGLDSIKNYLSSEELAMLQNDWHKLLDTAFTFMADDYEFDDLKLTGTFMYNANNIIMSHYPEVTLAWLRAEDNYYSYDNDEVVINYVNPSAPKVYKAEDDTEIANNTTLEKATPVKLLTETANSDKTESSIVYYTLSAEGQESPIVENKLYRGQDINLTAINNDTTTYTITTYSSNAMKKSNSASYTVTIEKPVKITTNLKKFYNTGEYDDVVKVEYAYPGDTIVLKDENNNKNNAFAYWEFNGNKIGTVNTSALTTYEIPEGYDEIVINAHYKEKIDSIDLKISSPVAGEELATTGKAEIDDTENDVNVYWINNDKTTSTIGIAEYNTSYTVGVKIPTSFITDDTKTFSKFTKVNIYNGNTKIGEGTVKYSATDGSLRVSYEYPKTQKERLQEQPANLPDVVLKEAPANFEAHLPSKVYVKTETGNKEVSVSWNEDSTKTNNGSEHNYIGTIDLDSSNIDKGQYTNIITSRIYVDEDHEKTKISTPIANLNSGSYNGEQDLKLSVIEKADIYYTITDDGTDPADPTNGSTKYTEPIKLQEGKSYKVKAIAYPKDTENYKKGDISEFNYTINQMYTLTIKTLDTGILGENQISEVAYSTKYVKGTEIELLAPMLDNEAFSHWEDKDGNKVTNPNITITKNVTYTAVYNPIITKLEFVIDKPSANKELPNKVKTAKATVTNEYNIKEYLADIKYNYNDDKAQYNKNYVGTITLTDEAKENLFYMIDSNYELIVKDTDGNSYDAAINQTDEKQFDVYYTFKFTPNYTGTKSFNDVVAPTRMSESDIRKMLPESTEIYCEDNIMRNAKVTWKDISGYDQNSLDEQTINITGTIELPTDVLNENNLPLTTSIKVIIPKADITSSPEFESPSGEYDSELIIRLISEENSKTYYTISTNGTAPEDPTKNSNLYTGGIELSQSNTKDTKYIIKAMSIKDGKFNSVVSTEVYTILKSSTNKLIVSDVEDQVYTGKKITPKIYVKYGDKKLTEGTDYKVEYENNINIGVATIKITGKGEYQGKNATKTFNIVKKIDNDSSADGDDNTKSKSNPITGDNIIFYITMLGLSIIGLITVCTYKKRKK